MLSDSETIFFFYTDLIEKNGQQNLCLAKVCCTFHYNDNNSMTYKYLEHKFFCALKIDGDGGDLLHKVSIVFQTTVHMYS